MRRLALPVWPGGGGMRGWSLLRLYPSRWRVRYEEESGTRRRQPLSFAVAPTRARASTHIHPELASLAGRFDGSDRSRCAAVAAKSCRGPPRVLVLIALIVIGLGLLYAYRAQTPACLRLVPAVCH
jgi:hypothetical protein